MEIIKRDGRIEPYQSEKIKAAVAAALLSRSASDVYF